MVIKERTETSAPPVTYAIYVGDNEESKYMTCTTFVNVLGFVNHLGMKVEKSKVHFEESSKIKMRLNECLFFIRG